MTDTMSRDTAGTAPGDDPASTAQIVMTPATQGFPHIADDKYAAAMQQAKQGGSPTQDWFDVTNQTADFWGWMGDHTAPDDDPFAPGVDPDGNPIQMCSNGNVDMRNGAFYRGGDGVTAPAPSAAAVDGAEPPPIVGIGTIQTHNSTSGLSRNMSFGLSLAGIPGGIILSEKLFGDLLKPVYSNFKTYITKMSEQFKEASEVETPDIDPEAESEEPIEDASGEIGDVTGELAEEGVEYLAIDWGSVVAESAGLGAIAAIPLLVSFLGHKMVNSVEIHNCTDLDFGWSVAEQVHGQPSILPKDDSGKVIPKMDYNVDSWGDKTTVKVAYSADFQFINSTDLSSIGYVLTLQPRGGAGSPTDMVVSIPWAGDNTIWAGGSTGNPQQQYDNHSDPDGKLSVTAQADTYQVTMSITALSGETGGAFFYGILAVIEPKG